MNENLLHAKAISDGKSLDQLLELIGNYFCEQDTHKSYRIIGLNKNSFICLKTIKLYDEDADFGSGIYTEKGYIEVRFTDDKYIYSLPATQKQKELLKKYNKETEVSSYEAWNIIHDVIEQTRKEYERRKYEYEHRWDNLEPEDDMYLCDYYGVPNM